MASIETIKLPTEVVELISKTAIQEYRKARVAQLKVIKDKQLHNIELLLKNFRKFKVMALKAENKIIDINDQMLQDAITLGELIVPSIKTKKEKTLAIYNYMESMLEIYKRFVEYEKDEDKERAYLTIYHLYVADDKKSLREVANILCVEQAQIYRLRKKGFEDAAEFVFRNAILELEMSE